MDDILIACITDILAYLEAGREIKPTSCLHDQLRDCSKYIISDVDIAKNRCTEDIINEEEYNLENASETFKTLLKMCKKHSCYNCQGQGCPVCNGTGFIG